MASGISLLTTKGTKDTKDRIRHRRGAEVIINYSTPTSGVSEHRDENLSQRASPPNVLIGGAAPVSPVVSPVEPPIEAFGNDEL